MAATSTAEIFCERCKKTMRAEEFYTSNNLEKFPNGGKLTMCKKCITAHIDNYNPDTYLWILQDLDVPYVPEEWNRIIAKNVQNGKKITNMTVLGRYLSVMKLNQWTKYRWKDTEAIQQLEEKKIRETMERQGYSETEIVNVLQTSQIGLPTKPVVAPTKEELAQMDAELVIQQALKNAALRQQQEEDQTPEVEDYFDRDNNDSSFDDNLTDEDRIYLRLKWGKSYKPEEWVRLEQLYEEMMASYDIQGAGHIDTLKMVCKTSLKANQLLDIGDIDGAQKMMKMYESMMKAGNFTAAQNKTEQGEFVDSVGELIEMCEKEGYIERFYIEKPNDKVDFTIQDMQRYTRTLIQEETNLSDMIDAALKQNQKEDEDARNNTEDSIVDDTEMTLEDIEKTLKDQDYEDFNEFLDEELDEDMIAMSKEGI